MERISVLIEGDTVGEVVKGVAEEGEVVTVELRDENGFKIKVTGKVLEILEILEF